MKLRIGALQKTTLLDFPGKISAIAFTRGCNFSCPYCHNPGMVAHQGEILADADVMSFLTQRRRLLEGVVITGGEPTLQAGLEEFCSGLKSLGYAIKLDTNGSRPDVLRRLLQLNLLDYVAMDLKADPCRYPREISPVSPGKAIVESAALLNESELAHEFRVPCAAPFITGGTFRKILATAGNVAPLFLQAIRLEQVLTPDFFVKKGRALTRDEIELLKKQAESLGYTCAIR
jgi:pyruvate formate lyase activating enzyme